MGRSHDRKTNKHHCGEQVLTRTPLIGGFTRNKPFDKSNSTPTVEEETNELEEERVTFYFDITTALLLQQIGLFSLVLQPSPGDLLYSQGVRYRAALSQSKCQAVKRDHDVYVQIVTNQIWISHHGGVHLHSHV